MDLTSDAWAGGIVAGIGNSVAIGSGKQKLGWLAPGYIFATHNLALGGSAIAGFGIPSIDQRRRPRS